VGIGLFGSLDDLLHGSIFHGIPDIVPDSTGKEKGILGHHGNKPAQGRIVDIFYIIMIDQYPALLHPVEPGDQIHDRGLPASAVAHDRHDFTRPGLETDVAEHRLFLLVGEGDLLELDTALDLFQGYCLSSPGLEEILLRIQVDQFKDPAAGCPGPLNSQVDLAQPFDRFVDHGNNGIEKYKMSQVDLALQHLVS